MFTLGLIIGLLAGVALLVCHSLLYQGTEYINGKFFYIVPESEYVSSRFKALSWDREHEAQG